VTRISPYLSVNFQIKEAPVKFVLRSIARQKKQSNMQHQDTNIISLHKEGNPNPQNNLIEPAEPDSEATRLIGKKPRGLASCQAYAKTKFFSPWRQKSRFAQIA
jgi:hypothetical protein